MDQVVFYRAGALNHEAMYCYSYNMRKIACFCKYNDLLGELEKKLKSASD